VRITFSATDGNGHFLLPQPELTLNQLPATSTIGIDVSRFTPSSGKSPFLEAFLVPFPRILAASLLIMSLRPVSVLYG
jgi:hypothetical protein